MLHRHAISDSDWDRSKHLLPGQQGQHGGVARDNRLLLIDAVLYVARTSIDWADLPERLGNANSLWRRFDRWVAKGRWEPILAALREPDLEVLILDSTVIRAQPCAAGAKKVGRVWRPGRSGAWSQPGWFGTKIHGSFDGLGHPVELRQTAGQASDIGQAQDLLGNHKPEMVIADKGYDSDAFVEAIESRGAEAVIPPKSNRITPREYDRHTYRERNV